MRRAEDLNDLFSVTLPNIPSRALWVIGNVRQEMYYRVNYDEDNWDNLILQLERDHEV